MADMNFRHKCTCPSTRKGYNMIPSFFDPDRFDALYLPRHALVAEQATTIRRAGSLSKASEDKERVAVFGIDCQIGFTLPGASLAVPGAVGDMRRGASFILDNLSRITTLMFSLDTHRAFQVFHPAFWTDPKGDHPKPMSVITAADIKAGRWHAAEHNARMLQYCEALESTGRYVLTIWPFHTMLGAVDHALVPAIFEVALYHSLARQTQTLLVTKGEHPLTENYSVFEPEVKTLGDLNVGSFDSGLFEALMTHDRVYIWGEASSHCVAATLESLHDRILTTNPSFMERVFIIEDCMSPVPPVCDDTGTPIPGLDFPSIAKSRLQRLANAGMNIITSSDGLS